MRHEAVDHYLAIRIGFDPAALEPGRTAILESQHRLRAQQPGGYVHGLWWISLTDDRCILSVPPGAGHAIRAIMGQLRPSPETVEDGLVQMLRQAVDKALMAAGQFTVDAVFRDALYVCDARSLRSHQITGCRPLTDTSVPPTAGMSLPAACSQKGVAYGVVRDGEVVSCAFAHHTGAMEDTVCTVGLVTAERHRRHGYGRAALSALVGHFVARGGAAVYFCDPDNGPSVATAMSCGFVQYGTSLTLSAQGKAGDQGDQDCGDCPSRDHS